MQAKQLSKSKHMGKGESPQNDEPKRKNINNKKSICREQNQHFLDQTTHPNIYRPQLHGSLANDDWAKTQALNYLKTHKLEKNDFSSLIFRVEL